MVRPSHCNVFTTLSEKQYPLFVIGAKYVSKNMPLGVYSTKWKEKSMDPLVARLNQKGDRIRGGGRPIVFLKKRPKAGFWYTFLALYF